MNSQYEIEIEALIDETEKWRNYHRINRHYIEALACNIRLNALRQCLRIVKKTNE